MTSRDDIMRACAALEAKGVIVKTGAFRPGRLGMLEPVYVSAVVLGLMSEEEARRRINEGIKTARPKIR